MDIINVTDYDNIPSTNMTLCNCTNNENDIDIFIPALLVTIPRGLSFLCLISPIVYTLIKTLFNEKQKLSNINGENFIPKSSSKVYHNRAEQRR